MPPWHWKSSVAMEKRSQEPSKYLGTHIERTDADKAHIFDITFQDACLDSGTNGYNLVRVYTTVGFAIKYAPYHSLYGWHTSLTADEYHLVDVARTYTGI